MKRQLREAFRKHRLLFSEKTAWVLVAKQANKKTLYRDLEEDLLKVIKKYESQSAV